MVWLIIALPIVAVVASLITVVIASRNADTLVKGDYQKEGLALHQHTERDLRARQLGLAARIQQVNGELRVELSGHPEPTPESLVLLLTHPTQATKDFAVNLSHVDGKVYMGKASPSQGANWVVQLEPADQSWRLSGRWDAASGSTLELATPQTELPTHP